MRPSPVEWLTYKDAALRPTRNTSESRAERYALYLEQLECTTSRIGGILQEVLATEALRDAIVIVHGDHGSRINVTTPNQANLHRMHDVDFTDAFATHFAVRMPSAKPGVDTRSIAIDELFSAIVRQAAIPDGSEWIASPDVVITGKGDAKALRRPMAWPADR
jgi:arylsulfatase A-like enzyme